MSGYPVLLEGTRIEALIVGGGGVAERKAGALLRCGAVVRVVSPEISTGLRALVAGEGRLSIIERAYQTGDIGTATLVIAATGSRTVNGRVAADARANGRVVIVADSPGHGSGTSMAAHRVGALVIGVSAAGVPTAAKRIRDAVADRFDGRYAVALDAMSALRRRLLESDDPDAWVAANVALVGRDFCALVEGDDLPARVARWPVERTSASEAAAWP